MYRYDVCSAYTRAVKLSRSASQGENANSATIFNISQSRSHHSSTAVITWGSTWHRGPSTRCYRSTKRNNTSTGASKRPTRSTTILIWTRTRTSSPPLPISWRSSLATYFSAMMSSSRTLTMTVSRIQPMQLTSSSSRRRMRRRMP